MSPYTTYLPGIGVRRIKMFPFSSNCAYEFATCDLVKTRLLELQAEVKD